MCMSTEVLEDLLQMQLKVELEIMRLQLPNQERLKLKRF